MAIEDTIVKSIAILSETMRESMRQHREATPDAKELFSLTITQLHYLHAIRELTNSTITDLADKFGVQKSTVTVAINRLLQRGYVHKTPSATDLRVVHIRLSDKGQQLLQIEDMGYYHFAREITGVLDQRESDQFARLLEKVINTMTRS
jgi:DNA-binding MarR family transcriptional regulator